MQQPPPCAFARVSYTDCVEKDYYAILGIKHGATKDQIKLAYRELALIHHPDRNPGNAEASRKFMRVKEAYQVLSDPRTRRLHDLRLRTVRPVPYGAPPPAWRPPPRPPVQEKAPARGWTGGHAVIAVGVLLALRGFAGAYLGGSDRAFMLGLAGMVVCFLGGGMLMQGGRRGGGY
jgi:curved DNA-binding protein CbpA